MFKKSLGLMQEFKNVHLPLRIRNWIITESYEYPIHRLPSISMLK